MSKFSETQDFEKPGGCKSDTKNPDMQTVELHEKVFSLPAARF